MRTFLLLSFVLLCALYANAQVGIGTTTPNGALDITSSTDGLLIPRIALTSTANVLPVLTATTSELVYNTATVADVTPGFYYLNSSLGPWVRLGGATGWLTTGNTNIVNGTNFIGTAAATNVDVAFRRNNLAAGRIGTTSTNFGLASANSNTAAGTTAFGVSALAANVGAIGNTAVGYNALASSTSANNTAIGYAALDGISSGASDRNVAIGVNALGSTTGSTVSHNVAIGYDALSTCSSSNNVAIGHQAMLQVTSGSNNVAVGDGAMTQGNSSSNTAIGKEALFNTSGSNNVAIGYFAGRSNGAGSNSTIIGYQADASGRINSTAIGYQANATANNQIQLGNNLISSARIQVAWTITSDKRFKSNIKELDLGLDFVKSLRPVSYFRNNDDTQKTEFGFIAQEIEEVLLKSGYANNGVISTDGAGMYGVRYNDFIPITVKAVQEQQLLIDELQQANAALIKLNTDILKRLEALENKTIN